MSGPLLIIRWYSLLTVGTPGFHADHADCGIEGKDEDRTHSGRRAEEAHGLNDPDQEAHILLSLLAAGHHLDPYELAESTELVWIKHPGGRLTTREK